MFLLALTLASGACRNAHTVVQFQTIDWRTSPLDLDLRGMIGKSYAFRCPPGKPVPESVTGSGVYTDGSSICAAAAHAGAIDAQRGGVVTIQILPGRSGYAGSTQNFIQSLDYPQPWGGSFVVLSNIDSHGNGPLRNSLSRSTPRIQMPAPTWQANDPAQRDIPASG